MANHVRQQIRERIATDLTGLTTTGSKVYQSRVYPAIAGDRTANGLAKDSYLTLTDIAYNGEGSKPVAFVQMTFMVEYMVNELTPDQAQ